ncbi:MAG: hypothetical protein KAU60_06860 [Desulfobacterales bacterium]|nr:hypothetical protein [Desulfobacterales bacterium]
MNDENNLDQGVEKAQPLEEEEIIELTDEVTEASINDDLASSIGIDNALEKEISGDQDVTDRFAGSLGMDLEPEIDALEDIHEEVSLSPEHLEETLERVVKKMFSEKIEKMLAEMIEAAVSKEIKSIKERLLDDEFPDRTNP